MQWLTTLALTIVPGCWLVLASAVALPVRAVTTPSAAPASTRRTEATASTQTICPDDPEVLVEQMLMSLPSYANRAIQRLQLESPVYKPQTYVLVAGRPEFQPLPLGPGQQPANADPDLQQVFFTTLERHYGLNEVFLLEQYHWLFLADTASGWRLAMMFSQTKVDSPQEPTSPPRESSEGAIAQAVRLWLRDCRAGALNPPAVVPEEQGS